MAPHHNTAVRSLLTNFFRRKTVSVSAGWLVRFGRNATQFRPKEDTGNAFYLCFVPSSEALPQLIRLSGEKTHNKCHGLEESSPHVPNITTQNKRF